MTLKWKDFYKEKWGVCSIMWVHSTGEISKPFCETTWKMRISATSWTHAFLRNYRPFWFSNHCLGWFKLLPDLTSKKQTLFTTASCWTCDQLGVLPRPGSCVIPHRNYRNPNSCDHLIISQQMSADELILNISPPGRDLFSAYLRWMGEITPGKDRH